MISISECTLFPPITCTVKEKISSAAKKLKKNSVRHLYVIDNKKKLLGIFSAVDVINKIIAEGKDYRKLSVKNVMKTDIVSFKKTDSLTAAFGFMSQTSVFSVPIVENNKLIGVLTYKDVMTTIMKKKQSMKK